MFGTLYKLRILIIFESLKNKKSILKYKIGQKYAINVGGSVVRLQESKPEFKYGWYTTFCRAALSLEGENKRNKTVITQFGAPKLRFDTGDLSTYLLLSANSLAHLPTSQWSKSN